MYKSAEGANIAYYKRSPDEMYLFYQDNRWVLEEVLGKYSDEDVVEYHGWIRHEGPPTCPEQVEDTWKFWDSVVGYSQSDTISVNAVAGVFSNIHQKRLYAINIMISIIAFY